MGDGMAWTPRRRGRDRHRVGGRRSVLVVERRGDHDDGGAERERSTRPDAAEFDAGVP
jgi:hypothetical protein